MMNEERIISIAEEDTDERLRDELEARNNTLLDVFAEDLQSLGLKKRALEDHLFNAHTFINLFLFTGIDSPYTIEQGVDRLDEYFGYFFIRKCMWSNDKNLPENVESVRLFYKSMAEHGEIKTEQYRAVEATIREKMNDWADDMRQWNEEVDVVGEELPF